MLSNENNHIDGDSEAEANIDLKLSIFLVHNNNEFAVIIYTESGSEDDYLAELKDFFEALKAKDFQITRNKTTLGLSVSSSKESLAKIGVPFPIIATFAVSIAQISVSTSIPDFFKKMSKSFYSSYLKGKDYSRFWSESRRKSEISKRKDDPITEFISIPNENKGVDKIKRVYEGIKTFWNDPQHANNNTVRALWSSLDFASRRDFLKTVLPLLPNSVRDPYCEINGVRELVNGITILCPVINIAYLTVHLLTVLEQWTDPVYNFEDHARTALRFYRGLDASAKTHVVSCPNEYDRNVFYDLSSDKFGQTLVFDALQPGSGAKAARSQFEGLTRKAVRAGVFATNVEFFFVYKQLEHTVESMALIIDEIRGTVLRKSSNKMMSPLYTAMDSEGSVCCSFCECVIVSVDSSPLKCGQCRLVSYCSVFCQEGDWNRHKLLCNCMTLPVNVNATGDK